MIKFGKKYRMLYIKNEGSKDEEVAIVEPPFSLQVEVTRNNFGSSNLGQVRLYNISKANREFMRKDWVSLDQRDRVILSAGYGENLVTILNMNVSKAFSVHQGVDYITQISCLDGGYAVTNAKSESNAVEGELVRDIVIREAKKLEPYGVGLGTIGNIPGEIMRGQTYSGSVLSNLDVLTKNKGFIDNSSYNVLGDDEAIKGVLTKIDASNGLLSTPMRQTSYIEFEMIFEPQISIGGLIELESSRGDKDANGQYIVTYLSHRGMFSETTKSVVTTEIGCMEGSFYGI